jgi:hypothetical protein
VNDPFKPVLNWVDHEDPDIVITGGAVLAGKLVRLQARWQPSRIYMGPERFTIVRSRTNLAWLTGSRHRDEVIEMWADFDGPPTTHSQGAWRAGNVNQFSQQSRYFFTDSSHNRSGELTVSNVAHYTSAPSFMVEGRLAPPFLLATNTVGVIARAGQAKTVYHVGATSDPRVRVSLMVPTGDRSPNDLNDYLLRLAQGSSPDPLFGYSLPFSHRQTQWRPAFENGRQVLEFDVDEDHVAEVSVVPEAPYTERRTPFSTAFALRVEDAEDPSKFVVSDVITVEGGDFGDYRRRPYSEGAVLFRV